MPDITVNAARGSSVLLGQSIMSGVLRILNIMILARLLLQDNMGQIAILGIIYGYLQFLGALGLNHAAPLFIPKTEKSGYEDSVRTFLKWSIIIIIISSCGFGLLAFLFLPLLIPTSILSSQLIHLVVLITPFSALEVFLDSFLLARYKVRNLAAGRLLFDLARVFLSVWLVLVGIGVVGVIYGWLIGEIIAVAIFSIFSKSGLRTQSSSIQIGAVLGFALPNLLFQAIDVTIQNTDRVILLQHTNLAALGVYDVLLGILFMMSFVSLTVSTSLYPVLTRVRIAAEDDSTPDQTMGKAVSSLVRYVLVLLLPVSAIVALNSHSILTLLFGSSYADYPYASLSFSILVVSYALWGVTYALHTILRSIGEARFFIITGIGVLTFEVIGSWYLTLSLGLLGSAIIRSLYVILLAALAWVRLHQKNIRATRVVVRSGLKISFSSLISGLIILFLAPNNYLCLAVSVLLAILGYLIMLFATREVNEFDFRIAKAVLPSFLHSLLDRINRAYFRKQSDGTKTNKTRQYM